MELFATETEEQASKPKAGKAKQITYDELVKQLQTALSDNPDYRAEATKNADLRGKISDLQGKRARLVEEGGDLEKLADQIEAGKQLKQSDSIGKLKQLDDHLAAHQIALDRSNERLTEIKRNVSGGLQQEFAEQHLRRMRKAVTAFEELDEAMVTLPDFERAFKKAGLEPGNAFPQYFHQGWMSLRNRIGMGIEQAESFLSRRGF